MPCVCHPAVCCVQVFAKFDTSEEKLEPLSAELQVKALPVFKFYKVCQGLRFRILGFRKV